MVIRIIAIKAVLDSNFYNCFLIRMWKDLDQDPYDIWLQSLFFLSLWERKHLFSCIDIHINIYSLYNVCMCVYN